MNNQAVIHSIKSGASQLLLSHSLRAQMIGGFKLIAAAIVLAAASYTGTTLTLSSQITDMSQRLSAVEIEFSLYESVASDVNATYETQLEMKTQAHLNKQAILLKLSALESKQAQHLSLTRSIQAEQHRRTHPITTSQHNTKQINTLNKRINELISNTRLHHHTSSQY
ncbi:MAG: hypothetical protein OEY11_14665 [Gammaproteobacteria bacterium]|nr:hypothetical protein [Gammaproteobacteria bacterium]